MDEELTITFDRGGFPVELLDERDWRRAIARGHVKRDTAVTLLSRSEGPRVLPARDVPELAHIFRELEPARSTEPAPGAFDEKANEPLEPQALAGPNEFGIADAASVAPGPSSWLAAEPIEQSAYIPDRPQASLQWRHAFLFAGALLIVWAMVALVSGASNSPVGSIGAPATSDSPAAEAEAVAPRRDVFETSFDCSAASSNAERLICGSAELAAQDRQMARLYEAARARFDGSSRTALEQDQRAWLRRRDACGEALAAGACLHRAYVDRIGELQPRRVEPPALDGSGPGRQSDRARPARQPRETATAPAAENVLCVLPTGGEAVMSLDNCRARSGVVFRN